MYTRAKIFSEIGKKTEMFARFSTVAGERASYPGCSSMRSLRNVSAAIASTAAEKKAPHQGRLIGNFRFRLTLVYFL